MSASIPHGEVRGKDDEHSIPRDVIGSGELANATSAIAEVKLVASDDVSISVASASDAAFMTVRPPQPPAPSSTRRARGSVFNSTMRPHSAACTSSAPSCR